jgi:phosphoribosylformimino-5-aminoimidazole carboxamide ribotide isomerase
MIVIPAVDLREGACVQLVGGEYDAEKVRLEDPVAVARDWARLGFRRLHVVDLDAATGRGSNARLVEEIVRDGGMEFVQVGGGVRDEDAVERVLSAGAAAVVVGTRGVEDPDWLAELADRYPGEIILAADVRERRVVTRGWARTLPRDVVDLVEELAGLPLAAIMVTAVHKEGQMQGTDLPLMEDVAESATVPVFASGGVSTMQDLRALADRGVAGAIVGMALYTGAIDPRSAIGEFHESDWSRVIATGTDSQRCRPSRERRRRRRSASRCTPARGGAPRRGWTPASRSSTTCSSRSRATRGSTST